MDVGTLENEQGVTKSPEMSLDSFFLEIVVVFCKLAWKSTMY